MESMEKVDWHINRGGWWVVEQNPTLAKQIVDIVKDRYLVKDSYGL